LIFVFAYTEFFIFYFNDGNIIIGEVYFAEVICNFEKFMVYSLWFLVYGSVN